MGGSGDMAGIAMALILASRFLGPLMRNVGPGGRHFALVALAVMVPLGVGARVWRERRENRAIAAARAKRLRAKAGRPSPVDAVSPAVDESGPDAEGTSRDRPAERLDNAAPGNLQ